MSVPRWETIAESVPGFNKPGSQDWHAAEGTGTAEDPLVLAVADGHGSAAHSRSHIGARLAVEIFMGLAREFAGFARTMVEDEPGGLRRLMNCARHELPRQLVSSWQQGALGHWERHHDDTRRPPGPGDEHKLLLYGSTLIGAVLTPRLFVAWQLGDGELTVVERDGTVSLPLAPAGPELGDETESLCSREAWRLVRAHWAPVVDPGRMPRLIALSTDGLSKSFASDEGFTQFMRDVAQRLDTAGPDGVRGALPEWLGHAAKYSGDDTTLAAGWQPPHHPETENRENP